MTEPVNPDRSADPGPRPDPVDVAEVEAVNRAFYTAFEAGDVDAMRSLWVDEPDALCIHPGAMPLRGTSEISRSWAVVMASTPYIQFFLTDVEISVRGDVASVTCTENVLTAGEATDESSFGGGRAVGTNLFVRTTEGWRLWIHHASPVVSSGHDDHQ